jgi:two-component system cell cycle sensor histidine kinase PleC
VTVSAKRLARSHARDLPIAVQGQLVALLFASPWPVVTSMAVTLASSFLIWQGFSSLLRIGWTLASLLVCMARLMLLCQYRRRKPAAEQAGIWADMFVTALTVTGALWGATALVVLYSDNPLQYTLTMIVIAGLVAGAATTYACYVPAVDAFLWTAILPLVVACGTRGSASHFVLAVVLMLFAFNLSVMARGGNRTIVRTLMLAYEKDRLTSELIEEKARTELASRAKSDFLATMSHELRTPLNAIIGFSEVMMHGFFGPLGSDKYLEYARDIHGSASHLLSLISDILDTAKVEAGKYVLDEVSVDLVALAQQASRLVRDRAIQKRVALSVSSYAMPPVLADERAIIQIYLNLITNAVKFTERDGRVDVVIGLGADGAPFIEVRDTGIGIPEEDMTAILGNYHRASNAYLSGEGGTGLGLPIVRSLVALHGGKLEITSRQGIGTSVVVRLPGTRLASLPVAPASSAAEPPRLTLFPS